VALLTFSCGRVALLTFSCGRVALLTSSCSRVALLQSGRGGVALLQSPAERDQAVAPAAVGRAGSGAGERTDSADAARAGSVASDGSGWHTQPQRSTSQ